MYNITVKKEISKLKRQEIVEFMSEQKEMTKVKQQSVVEKQMMMQRNLALKKLH